MQVQAISQFQSAPSAADGNQNQSDTLRSQFLTLLIVQLQNQDPLNPQDPSEFTAQLAQFTSLEQQIAANALLENQIALQEAQISTGAAAFIGNFAEVLSDRIGVEGGEVTEARYAIALDSAETTLRILDESGDVVRTINLGPQEPGSHEIEWDGLDDSGEAVADGVYRFEIQAVDADGNVMQAQLTAVGRIDSVSFIDGTVLLNVNGGLFTLADLLSLELEPEGESQPVPAGDPGGGPGSEPIPDPIEQVSRGGLMSRRFF